jgi:uncharacterized membrane protein YedE/YeeE/rhodanese-related sulfurtransferase
MDMSGLFPLEFINEEAHLLTGIIMGFFFGFTLERAGFGNARKLAAQFYFHDMAVFKVMFTAILVAMVGLYSLVAIGVVDMSRMWINPTFMWAQVIGGFLLGVGFIVSGLCPGTSMVSMFSGRIDGLVAFIGMFIGSFLFIVSIDWFPSLASLYTARSMGTSTLPEVFGVSAPTLILGIVVMAGLGMIGAEVVERIFQKRRQTVELTPAPTPRARNWKFALTGSLAVLVIAAIAASPAPPEVEPIAPAPMAPLSLAEDLIVGDPNLMVFDLRPTVMTEDGMVPGALPAADPAAALPYLRSLAPDTRVVVYDEVGIRPQIPQEWPRTLRYYFLEDGFVGWRTGVLTPVEQEGYDLEHREYVARQNQIAAFFSGAAVQSSEVSAPPPVISSGGAKKKKNRGC